MPTGDVPDAIKQMIQDRHDARVAAVAAAEQAAIVALPATARRDVLERAGSIGASVEVVGGGGELRLVVPLPADGRRAPGVTDPATAARPGPGILETSLVLGARILLALAIIVVLRGCAGRRDRRCSWTRRTGAADDAARRRRTDAPHRPRVDPRLTARDVPPVAAIVSLRSVGQAAYVRSGRILGAALIGGRPHGAHPRSSSPRIRQDEEGQGLAEYALILALIAIVAIVALIFLGGQVSTILSTVGNSV